jgi:sulfate adenylyltransferase
LTKDEADRLRGHSCVTLVFQDVEVGELRPESIYTCDKIAVSSRVFGNAEDRHPGVAYFMRSGDWFVGGPVKMHRRVSSEFSDQEMTPEETRAVFAERGWKTVTGFQTRNVPHRAHEHLQRLALEITDGLFIQPLVGRKKRGDYSPAAIVAGYRQLIEKFYPPQSVLLGILTTWMRYAGPREAVFHAIIRRNYGCTHFVVGRDHAGVGDYYGLYDAHELTRRFDGELGINVLRFRGPYHCSICDGIVTDKTCPHEKTAPKQVDHISGTDMRRILVDGGEPKPHLMRPEIVKSLENTALFVDEDER